ncbi:phage tail spike protein [Leuconostoc mesenteroides]|uniref:phage tail spike protein n=1 Tax=Leuconostoc mesenteroides TaxID=1245 RepID=UPI0032DF1B69
MTPILYKKDEIDFTSQGLGSLVEIYDVDVEEQHNGLLQLTASYPVSGLRYADISVGRIILAKPNQRDDVHAFRIVSTELDISGYAVTIEADSITYDLTHNLVKHLNASGNGQAFMTALKNAVVNPSIFAFYSDIATSSTTSLDYVNPMEAIMGTTGSFLQIWGGELKRENRRVAMFNRRGRDNVATFRLGKNISGLKYSVDISSLVTRIIPTKSVQNDDQTTTMLEGTPVDSQYINNYEQIYTLPLEFTDDTIKTVADLNAAAKGWFTQSANTGRDKPTVTIDIDVLSLQDSADYQDKFKNLESVSLTDTVTVYVPEYGVNVTAIVNELHYDPILNRVTKMTVGTAKQSFADNSRTQLSDLQDKIISVQNQADATAVSANGKNKNYYGSVQPSHPQEGDQWYWQDGDKSGIKQFINGEWMPLIDSNTQEKIEAGVNEAIAQANENTATAIEQNNISQQEVMNDIAKSQADLAIKDGDFNNKAQAMADEALANAKANTAMVAKETLDTATDNLNTAKQSLTTDLQTEISDRTNAVAALDIKANGYADQAKQDAIDAATTADGTINKKIDDTATSLTSKITQNQQDADGKITTAQSTATQALNEVKTKVSQTEYNTKTGQLTTDVNSVTQTANQSKQDIVSINQKDGNQDARMNSIESDASGTKQTVSQLQTVQGQQSGSISTLQQRADGFETTVTKVNNLAVGGRNYILDTANPKTQTSNGNDNQDLYNQAIFYSPIKNWGITNGDYILSFDWNLKTALSSDMQASVFFNQSPWQVQNFTVKAGQLTGHVEFKLKLWGSILTTANDVVGLNFRIMSQMASGNTITYSNLFMKSGTISTTWTPAPEDGEQATAKAQLTADTARTEISNYKTDADGRITKAQSDVTQTASLVATKVSQSDYDKKTGQLSTDVSNAQQTANSAVTTIGSYKTSNDNRVAAAESKISQNADAITLRATKTDLDAAKSDYTAKISQININYDGISQTVSQVSDKVNDLSQNNLINNSDFVPDLDGWYLTGNGSYSTGDYDYSGAVLVVANTGGGIVNLYSTAIPLNSAQSVTLSWSLNYYIFSVGTSGSSYIYMQYLDSNRNPVPDIYIGARDVSGNSGGWKQHVINNFVLVNIPSNAKYVRLVIDAREKGTRIGINRPMLVKSNKVGSYVSGRYNSNGKVASQQITIDGINNTVTQQGKDINSVTSRVQTAEGTLSTATDNISGLQSKQTQTANQLSQEITDRTNGDSNTLQSSKDFTQSSITSAVSGLNSTISQTASGILAQVESTNMVVNSEFDPLNGTWYALSNGGSTGSQLAEAWNAPKANGFADWPVVNGSRIISYAVGTWYTSALVTASAGKVFSASIVAGRSPAPTVSTALDYRIGFWDSSRKLLTTASAGNIIDGTVYKGIQKYVVENKTAPANTAFVSVIIAHSSANVTDYITRPSLNMGAKASPYTPTYGTSSSSTVLSLFKDNWSIGITDNIGAITSGIVGNNNSMSLISKNVIIDSPSTQITGTAWINSAMIKNGSIGTAQIGDASITSAKIISLDVARLTGNVSNFIQSNWNGIYGSTYITADGMSVSSGTVTTSFGAQGMRITMASNGGVVIQGSTKLNGTQTGVLIGMNVGSTFTSFGFQSSSNYLYNDEMVILKTGSAAAGDYNIGGGVAFNHNVSFMDNIYMKYGKGFYGKWGDPQQAIFFQTINSGIPAIMHISGAGIAFGHKGDLYMLSHGGYQDFNNSSIKGSYTVDQPWITG